MHIKHTKDESCDSCARNRKKGCSLPGSRKKTSFLSGPAPPPIGLVAIGTFFHTLKKKVAWPLRKELAASLMNKPIKIWLDYVIYPVTVVPMIHP